MADDLAAAARPKDYESAPYLTQKRRVQSLYTELRALGLESHVADLAMQGYTVVPPEKIAPPALIGALRKAG